MSISSQSHSPHILQSQENSSLFSVYRFAYSGHFILIELYKYSLQNASVFHSHYMDNDPTVWVHCILSIHLSLSIRSFFSPIFLLKLKCATIIHFVWIYVFLSFRYIIRSGEHEHRVILCLNFEEIPVFQSTQFSILTRKVWKFKLFATLLTLVVECLLDYRHLSGYKVVSESCSCLSLMTSDVKHLCMRLWAICTSSGEQFLHNLSPVFK